MNDERIRSAVWQMFGASHEETSELLTYARNTFTVDPRFDVQSFPLDDEPFVAVWRRYAAEAAQVGTFECLRRRLVQLRFPIERGISGTAAYRAATRRGDETGPPAGLALQRPETLRLAIHPTPAGGIPVVIVPARADFVSLVQALTRRNEPEPVPDAMGACIVGGYNNWDRVRAYRQAWAAGRAADECSDAEWAAAFSRLVPQKALYQDLFILASADPYSATPAEAVGLSSEEWTRASLAIRIEHESTHYFTRRVFGSMRNSLLDELMADYMGMTAAVGRFEARWFLRFMGLESPGGYRRGGRLENYRGDPPLSDAAFAVLGRAVRAAALTLEQCDEAGIIGRDSLTGQVSTIRALASVGLERLAGGNAAETLAAAMRAGRGGTAAADGAWRRPDSDVAAPRLRSGQAPRPGSGQAETVAS